MIKAQQIANIHNILKAQLMRERRAWEGNLSGKTPCQVCGIREATEAHHLIIQKSKIQGAAASIRLMAEHKFNLLLVCHECHHGLCSGGTTIEGRRLHLITREVFRLYQERTVRQWVAEMERHLGFRITLPFEECSHCVFGFGSIPCAFSDICDSAVRYVPARCSTVYCTRRFTSSIECRECPLKENL